MYTVKQLANLAGISVRTLHYYDEMGLLKPSSVGQNGYRYYGEESLLRLQQILFYRELDVKLAEIKHIIDNPQFDTLSALQAHKSALRSRVKRLNRLINTIDQTVLHIKGEKQMKNRKALFEDFSDVKQKEYEKEARKRWSFEGVKDWNKYTPEEKAKIKAESEDIYRDLLDNMDKGLESPTVQKIIARWHQHLRYFYEPSRERLSGLAQLYRDDPQFSATFRKIHPDMPQFLHDAILYYVKNLP